ncbi:MAG: hypothetical protein R3B51_07285 [Thermodesulfobacteriota bacterium]
MKDIVNYALPLGPLGRMVHNLDTKKRLDRIFDFRQDYVEGKFGTGTRSRG